MIESKEELKHSVLTHMKMLGGPNPQLCVHLVKLLDMFDDLEASIEHPELKETHLARVNSETTATAFHVIESLAIWMVNAVEHCELNDQLQTRRETLLTTVAKAKSMPNKIVGKNIVLQAIADTIREWKKLNTQVNFPDIKDSKGNLL